MKINNLKDKLITCGIFAVCLALYRLLHIPCPMQFFLHIPCPGCGMTRAFIHLLQLDFAGAFRLHPMFWSVPILGLFYFTDGHLFQQKWLNRAVLILIAAGFFINWMLQIAEVLL